jgi:hypothetical protein
VFITAIVQPGKQHHDRQNHLVFVLLNAESHGLTRIPPEAFTCECGAELSPDVLDAGDESKASWPNCKSWRDGGKKKCPECDSYPSIRREQHIRARGYEPTPKDEIKRATQAQRSETLDRHDGQCLVCEQEAEYVKRMVPPRYGGTREQKNLAPLCQRHHEGFGHMFADILQPAEWYKIEGITWRTVATDLREQYADAGVETAVERLDEALSRGQPPNPYPYIDA